MATARETMQMRLRTSSSQDMPDWLYRADSLPNRIVVTEQEKELINLVRKHGEFSKADLAVITRYSRTKITGCISSLLDKKIITSNEETEYTGGRRSKTFSLNGSLGLMAGVDTGATSIDLAIADFSGRMLARYTEPASIKEGPVKILDRVCSLLEGMLSEKHLAAANLKGVGIGVPGPVDFTAGTLVSPPIMPGWDRFPIIQTVQQRFTSANVVVDNDVNVMALGEIYQGAGKGFNNLIYVKIGTGIGAGIICEGQIYRGSSGCAGDIGHIGVNKSGPLCHCGNQGCLEAVAAGPAIAERALTAAQAGKSPILMNYYERNGRVLTAENIGEAAREGDVLSMEIIRESGKYIGDVLAGLVNFYNPGMIVIGGGVSNLGNLLLSSIRQTVLNRSTALATRDLHIVFSDIGPNAGVTGALNLAMDYSFTIA